MNGDKAGRATSTPRPATWAPGLVKRVVVPVEGGGDEMLAQEQAVRHAAALGAPVVGLHITRAAERDDDAIWAYLRQQCDRHDVEFSFLLLAGDDVAAEVAAELDAMDLVVVGTRRIGTRYHLESVAEHLIRHSPATIQVVRLHD